METTIPTRKPYPTDVSDEEWAFVAPYLTLMTADAPQRRHDLREVFNALRWIVRAGAPWRLLPMTFPPWEAVYQQTQRWISAGCFEAMAHDLRAMLRWCASRAEQPTAVIIDSATRQSTPESGRAPAMTGTRSAPAARSMRRSTRWGSCWPCWSPQPMPGPCTGGGLAAQVQAVTGETVELGFVDQGYSGEQAETDAAGHEKL